MKRVTVQSRVGYKLSIPNEGSLGQGRGRGRETSFWNTPAVGGQVNYAAPLTKLLTVHQVLCSQHWHRLI